jgi:hypothetical protein
MVGDESRGSGVCPVVQADVLTPMKTIMAVTTSRFEIPILDYLPATYPDEGRASTMLAEGNPVSSDRSCNGPSAKGLAFARGEGGSSFSRIHFKSATVFG